MKHEELRRVERAFRTAKSALETRPGYHKRDETPLGRVSASCLATVVVHETGRDRHDGQPWGSWMSQALGGQSRGRLRAAYFSAASLCQPFPLQVLQGMNKCPVPKQFMHGMMIFFGPFGPW